MKIEIEKSMLEAAYNVACGNTKEVLTALFGKENCKPSKATPTLDDYKTIQSYEDACAALGCAPIDEGALRSIGVRKGIIALMKVETISLSQMLKVQAVFTFLGLLYGLRTKLALPKSLYISL